MGGLKAEQARLDAALAQRRSVNLLLSLAIVHYELIDAAAGRYFAEAARLASLGAALAPAFLPCLIVVAALVALQ